MFNMKIAVHGKTWSDLEDAVEEALRVLKEENTSGYSQNDDGGFAYTVEESDGSA